MKSVFPKTVVMIMSISLFLTVLATSAVVVDGEVAEITEMTRIVSPVIRIDGDVQLASLAELEHWNGSGTADDPFVIEGLNINATDLGTGVYIGNTTSYLIVRNCLIYDLDFYDDYAIMMYNASNCQIVDNDLQGYYLIDIYLNRSSLNTVSGNVCNGSMQGIVLDESSNNTVSDNVCNCGPGGITLGHSVDNTISNNVCSSDIIGIVIYYSERNTVSNNTCEGDFAGIDMHYSSANTLSDNDCSSAYGILLYGVCDNTVSNNTCNGKGIGINLIDSTNNTISWNECNGGHYGLYVSSDCGLGGNTVSYNTCIGDAYGICIDMSDGNTIVNNDCINDGRRGIFIMSDSEDNIISGNVGSIVFSSSSAFPFDNYSIPLMVIIIFLLSSLMIIHMDQRSKR